MPIRSYFEPRPMGWRPEGTFLKGGLGRGIAVTGPVLEGLMSVEEAMVLSRIRGSSTEERVESKAGSLSSARGSIRKLESRDEATGDGVRLMPAGPSIPK